MMEPAYYAVIPANVRYAKEVCPNAKLLFGEITALCNFKGYCWASNKYFSDLYDVAPTTISEWVKQLVKGGFIRFEVVPNKDGSERRIYLTGGGYSVKPEDPPSGKGEGGSSGKPEANTTGVIDPSNEGARKRARVSNVVTAQDLTGYVFPPSLEAEDFRSAVEEWRAYKTGELRQQFTRQMLTRLLTDALKRGAKQYAEDIRFSINKTWRGIFEAKNTVKGTKKETESGQWKGGTTPYEVKPDEKAQTDEERKADLERLRAVKDKIRKNQYEE